MRLPIGAPDGSTSDYLTETLVTDTVVYQVVARTASTIRVRRTRETGERWADGRCDVGAHGLTVQWCAVAPDADDTPRTVRRRKDGTYRAGGPSSRPLRDAPTVGGVPVRRVDMRA